MDRFFTNKDMPHTVSTRNIILSMEITFPFDVGQNVWLLTTHYNISADFVHTHVPFNEHYPQSAQLDIESRFYARRSQTAVAKPKFNFSFRFYFGQTNYTI